MREAASVRARVGGRKIGAVLCKFAPEAAEPYCIAAGAASPESNDMPSTIPETSGIGWEAVATAHRIESSIF